MVTDSMGKLDYLIGRFYDAAAAPDLWREVLAEVAEVFKAEGACILPGPNSPLTPTNSESLDEAVLYGIKHGWYVNSPRAARGVARLSHPGDLITESMIFSREELDRVPFNAEFVDRFRLRWFIGGLLVPDPSSPAVFSIERRKDQQPFSSEELEVVRSIVPHLQRAGRIATEWAKARSLGAVDAFEHLGDGAILFDYGGRVIRMTKPAEPHLRTALRLVNRQLVARDRRSNDRLQKLIGSIIAPDRPGKLEGADPIALARPSARPLLASGALVGGIHPQSIQTGRGILLLTDPDRRVIPSSQALRSLFNFTATETTAAQLFAEGHDVSELAEQMKITVGTARLHMKSMMNKTETHRQSELALLLSRLAR
jgi:DNA-binding CsgD family transcriptional regulator